MRLVGLDCDALDLEVDVVLAGVIEGLFEYLRRLEACCLDVLYVLLLREGA